ncbi:MAG: hypothetical protein AB4911_01930 [Oscillochloridaceae bacterium umkhey_bin13]
MALPWSGFRRLLIIGGVLGVVALALRPDPRDSLRAADQLFAAGRYHEALVHYQRLAPALPEAELRVGLVRTLRGERAPAERAIRTAMQRGLPPRDYHLGLLYLGRALADDGSTRLARQTWELTQACIEAASCAYQAPAQVLMAELSRQEGAYAAAEQAYGAVLATPLPPGWAAQAQYAQALLRATHDPQAALALLQEPLLATSPPDPWLAPLLTGMDRRDLLFAALTTEPTQRPLLLGQIYLDQGHPDLALAQFAALEPTGPDGLRAAAYAAYAQSLNGDPAGGLAQLEALAAQHPDEAQLRLLLALSYLRADASDAAQAQLEVLAADQPNAPDLQLAWASWHAARREYDLASLAYDRALAATPRERWAGIALAAARFHLATTYELCPIGLPLGELAANERPNDPQALTTVAALRYHCGQFRSASDAAQAALAAGAGPEAAYYLGVALAAQDQAGAMTALLRSADMAPASDWRRRAEIALEQLR